MDADGLIDRNRALVALAEQTCRGSLEATALAREVRRSAAETHDKAVQIICQSSVIRRLSSSTISAGKGTPVSPQYAQRLKAEAEELHARARALVGANRVPDNTPADLNRLCFHDDPHQRAIARSLDEELLESGIGKPHQGLLVRTNIDRQ